MDPGTLSRPPPIKHRPINHWMEMEAKLRRNAGASRSMSGAAGIESIDVPLEPLLNQRSFRQSIPDEREFFLSPFPVCTVSTGEELATFDANTALC